MDCTIVYAVPIPRSECCISIAFELGNVSLVLFRTKACPGLSV